MNVIIQDVKTNGVVDRDGRLQPGDHLLEVGPHLRSRYSCTLI